MAFALSLGGCANQAHPPAASTVTQKPVTGQTSNYRPYYQPVTPGYAVSPAPVPSGLRPVAPLITSAAPVIPGKIKVAILLPLSGKNAALGQAMLNAAQQAVFDAASDNFELQPRDTEGGAADAARTAVNDGAQLIIGPLFATDVPVVKAVAQNAGLEMLPLSTDTSLAEHGVYVMGLAPGAQVERVVAYALAHGAHHFAAIVPATPYGTLVAQVFHNAVMQQGGQPVDIETVDPAAPATAIKNLAPQRDQIDALLLPEAGGDLKNLTDALSAAGFSSAHTHILGTGLWDIAGLGRQNPFVVGGWYAAPDPATRRNFVASYAAAYGHEPPRLATLAYDATALAAVLAKQGGRYNDAALTNPNGFAGLDGVFRLLPSGTVERMLAVNEVTADGAQVVDPAPNSFVIKAR